MKQEIIKWMNSPIDGRENDLKATPLEFIKLLLYIFIPFIIIKEFILVPAFPQQFPQLLPTHLIHDPFLATWEIYSSPYFISSITIGFLLATLVFLIVFGERSFKRV